MKFKNSALGVGFVSLLAFSLISALRTTADGTAATPSEAASLSTMTTILPLSEAQALFKFYFDADSIFGKQHGGHRKKETYWTPTAADVAQAELALFDYMKVTDVPHTTKPQHLVPKEYFRQYAGVMRGDKKCLLINCYATSTASTFSPKRNKAILVFDGGSAFFHASYNPATHQIENVQFNGVA